jgi:hypothetical protein
MRTGKIARLPKQLRDIVNRMMDDNCQSRSIILELHKHRHLWPPELDDISENNLTNWRSGGYIDWTRERALQADLEEGRGFAAHAATDDDSKVPDVVLQIGLNQMFHRLASFDRFTVDADSLKDPTVHARILNAMNRLVRTSIENQKYKDHVRECKARIESQLEELEKPGGLTPDAVTKIKKEFKLL